ncbi:MAG TPA: DUF2807 domain-containing protein [Telluria sp.]|nr:DUF2807 domain-containing protein [Telluria sp.]
MRTLSVLALACATLLGGCAIVIAPGNGESGVYTAWSSKTVEGNGNLQSERRDVAALRSLNVGGRMHTEVRVGGAPSLEIEADSNLLPLIKTEQSGETLRIWMEGSVKTDNPIRVRYTVAALDQVTQAGSGRTNITGLNGGTFTLVATGSGRTELSGRVERLNAQLTGSGGVSAAGLAIGDANVKLTGSGSMVLGTVNGRSLSANLHGSGQIEAGGTVEKLNANVHGSGGANFARLSSQVADLSSHGSGDISAIVKDSVVARSEGSGHITVYGNPAQRTVSGKRVQVLN